MKPEVLGGKTTAILPIKDEESHAPSNQQISDALVVQARQLMNLAHVLNPDLEAADASQTNFLEPISESAPAIFQTDRPMEPDTRHMARNAYRARRLRDTIFNDFGLFGEPAWDILLDLAHATFSGLRVPVSSACVGACVPPTTGLRWLSILENAGLLERQDDLLDGRRTYVRLSRKGLLKMEEYLRASRSIG